MQSNLPIAVRIIIAKERCLHCLGTLWLDEGEWKCSMCGRAGGAGVRPPRVPDPSGPAGYGFALMGFLIPATVPESARTWSIKNAKFSNVRD